MKPNCPSYGYIKVFSVMVVRGKYSFINTSVDFCFSVFGTIL